MIIIDSSGWVEYFANGPLKDKFKKFITGPSDIITPTIVLFEVYRKIRRDAGRDEALVAAGFLKETHVAPLTETIALTAAEFSIEHSLHMADSIIYATAFEYGCKIVTSDAHFEKLENVIYIKK